MALRRQCHCQVLPSLRQCSIPRRTLPRLFSSSAVSHLHPDEDPSASSSSVSSSWRLPPPSGRSQGNGSALDPFSVQSPRSSNSASRDRRQSYRNRLVQRPVMEHDMLSASQRSERMQWKAALKSKDLEAAWKLRKSMIESGHWQTVPLNERTFLRIMIESACEADTEPTSAAEYRQELLQESIDRLLQSNDEHLLNWICSITNKGRTSFRTALDLIEHFFEKAKLHECFTSSPAPVTTQPDTTAEDVSERPTPARPKMPSRVVDLLILAAFCHQQLSNTVAPLFSLVRMLPVPDRAQYWLSQQDRVRNVLAQATRKTHETAGKINFEAEAKRLAAAMDRLELFYGLDRPEEEVGHNPLGRLFSEVLKNQKSETPGRLVDALISATRSPDQGGVLWVQGLPPPHGMHFARLRTSPDVDEATWSIVLRQSIVARNLKAAQKVWQHITAVGLPVTPTVYHGLLAGYVETEQWDAAEQVWGDLASKQGAAGPDPHCYTTMMNCLFRQGKSIAAMELFRQLQLKAADASNNRNGLRPTDFQISALTYNVTLAALLRFSRKNEAQILLNSMLDPARPSSVPAPNTETLNHLINRYSRSGDLDGMMRLLLASSNWPGVKPDVYTFTTVLAGLVRHGKQGSSQQNVAAIQEVMRSCGVKWSTTSWTEIMRGVLQTVEPPTQLEERDPIPVWRAVDALKVAFQTLSAMQDDNCRPSSVTYSVLMQAAVSVQRIIDAQPEPASHLLSVDDPAFKPHLALEAKTSLREDRATFMDFCVGSPGTAIALGLWESMVSNSKSKSGYQIFGQSQPNRTTLHLILGHVLRRCPPSASGSKTDSASAQTMFIAKLRTNRLAFTRGMAILEEYLRELQYEPDALPKAPQILAPFMQGMLSQYPSTDPRFAWQVPADRPSYTIPPRGNYPLPTPNDVSLRIILYALLGRLREILTQMQQHGLVLPRNRADVAALLGPEGKDINLYTELLMTRRAIEILMPRAKYVEEVYEVRKAASHPHPATAAQQRANLLTLIQNTISSSPSSPFSTPTPFFPHSASPLQLSILATLLDDHIGPAEAITRIARDEERDLRAWGISGMVHRHTLDLLRKSAIWALRLTETRLDADADAERARGPR